MITMIQSRSDLNPQIPLSGWHDPDKCNFGIESTDSSEVSLIFEDFEIP
jgi:hypothetical protein